MAEIKEYLDSKGKTIDDINQKFVQGWSAAKVMVAGIQAAAEKYPEGDLTGTQIREGLESLQDFDLRWTWCKCIVQRGQPCRY